MAYEVKYVCRDKGKEMSYVFASKAVAESYARTVKGATVVPVEKDVPEVVPKVLPPQPIPEEGTTVKATGRRS